VYYLFFAQRCCLHFMSRVQLCGHGWRHDACMMHTCIYSPSHDTVSITMNACMYARKVPCCVRQLSEAFQSSM
jgi:hypothetical protein